jgi:hypothetical protein
MSCYRIGYVTRWPWSVVHRTLLGVTNPVVPIPESVKERTMSRVRDVRGLVLHCTTDVKSTEIKDLSYRHRPSRNYRRTTPN